MPKVFGTLDAVRVEHPDESESLYLVVPLAANPGVWRMWCVTSPDGKSYTVREYPSGRWSCTCQHWYYRGQWNVKSPGCKHIFSIRNYLEESACGPKATPESSTG